MHLNKGPEPAAADVRAQRPRPRLVRELAILAAVVALYVGISRGGGLSREGIALAHGRDLLNFEQFLHIDVERPLNAWLAPQNVLSVLANYEYAFGYVTTSFGLLIILYLTRSPWYRWARSGFVLVNLIGISIFAIYPAAPPRLLPGEGFVDTVTQGGTFGSWGSPYTADANHLAAMPSLHVGWAVWFTIVVSSIFAGRWWVKAICLLYVATTTTVIMATANHYILDAVGGALVTLVSIGLLTLVTDKPGTRRPRLTPTEAFALHAETTSGAAQHAGHVIVLRDERAGAAYRAELETRFRAALDRLPRFRHRVAEGSFWRRPRWAPAGDLDWGWHLPVKAVSGPAELEAFVACLQRAPLPRDRPLWRCWTVTGVARGEIAVVLLTHHALSAGTVTTELFDPVPEPAETPRRSALKRAGAVVTGLAELAREGPARRALPSGAPRDRDYGMSRVPASVVRAAAHGYGVEVDDVLRAAGAGALRQLLPAGVAGAEVRVALPHSTAVLMDLPLAPDDEVERLRETARRGDRLRSGTRAMAARFVVGTASGVLPPPAQRWFAKVVYGKRSFEGIVAVLAGPAGAYRLAGGAVHWVHPVAPLAPGAPFAVGVIGWDRWLDIGVSVDPALGADAHRLATAMVAVIDELARRSGAAQARPRTRSSEEFGPFWPVFREEGIPVRKDMS
ncbi:phosphatase PAP2 family protein [Asanoa sp. WMMD1127]|uniref:bifunctional phosphatase PAP2/O-acyltransferase family protein n=1 Tax=Asanoa sp. WMMD1127 TaxID=3016107 RepID=UPI00241603D9|nr:phosphatase PAP2 family protein [Asanoa sp. WMMD1127]MDG4827488.1 phosphatase PAP2 family protein [Asanoa sp. WMMD1127]